MEFYSLSSELKALLKKDCFLEEEDPSLVIKGGTLHQKLDSKNLGCADKPKGSSPLFIIRELKGLCADKFTPNYVAYDFSLFRKSSLLRLQ
jgi:hypothetical protein